MDRQISLNSQTDEKATADQTENVVMSQAAIESYGPSGMYIIGILLVS